MRLGLAAGLALACAAAHAQTSPPIYLARARALFATLLVEGPTLLLPSTGRFDFSFNPSTLISLGEAGTAYPTFHVVSGCGTLDVTGGAPVPTDFTRATVASPKSPPAGSHVEGPGWTLDLAPGWTIAPAQRPGSFTLRKAS